MKEARIAVIMGSESDLEVMQNAVDVLDELSLEREVTIVSAHRTPQRMFDYARSAQERGIGVIIAGAGGAAHLPGMVAALTPLPVIGVPVRTSHLQGLDSLYSIVQMPRGVPVATVAINNARNAGILAGRIVALYDSEVRSRLEQYHAAQTESVEQSAAHLEEIGPQSFLEELARRREHQ